MSSSYKAVLIFSILMLIGTLLSLLDSEQKSNAIGILYWGYIIWHMLKRNNKTLAISLKYFLWFVLFSGVLGGIALGYFSFEDSSFRAALVMYLAIFSFVALIDYLLLQFFELQVLNDRVSELTSNSPPSYSDLNVNNKKNSNSENNSPTNQPTTQFLSQNTAQSCYQNSQEEIYLKIYEELENKTFDKALWIRLFSEFNGDENKTKAQYVRERFTVLNGKNLSNPNSPSETTSSKEINRTSKNFTNDIGKNEYFPFNKFTVIDTVRNFGVDKEVAMKILALNIRKSNDFFLYKHLTFNSLEEALDCAKTNPPKNSETNTNETMPITISCPMCRTTNLKKRDDCVSCGYDFRQLKKIFGE